MLEAVKQLKESPDYELHRLTIRTPAFFDEAVNRHVEDLEKELAALADELAKEIEELTSEAAPGAGHRVAGCQGQSWNFSLAGEYCRLPERGAHTALGGAAPWPVFCSCAIVSFRYYCSMPRKLRQLIKDLEKAGFEFTPGKGSHRKFYHPLTKQVVIVSGGLGDDVHRYQERDLQKAVDAVKKQKEQP